MAWRSALVLAVILGAAPALGQGEACRPGDEVVCPFAAAAAETDEVELHQLRVTKTPSKESKRLGEAAANCLLHGPCLATEQCCTPVGAMDGFCCPKTSICPMMGTKCD
mmetsp:Transcript_58174/g.177274  ORF Transcript_58174/g.177274 Transcript_58174/m.177274 type:complete len:109 (-) Transcript_58174:237-563(-)